MQPELKIVIIEDNAMDRQSLIDSAARASFMTVVAATSSDEEGIEYVKDFLPHAVILDLELHEGVGSGVSFLKMLNEIEVPLRPFVLVTTHNSSHIVHTQVRKLGADFIMSKMQKGYCADSVISFLSDMRDVIFSSVAPNNTTRPSGNEGAVSPAQSAKRLMNRLNAEFDNIEMSHKLSGRRYLIEVICLIVESTYVENDAVKVVAKRNKKTDIATIQAMTNAIKKTWLTANDESLYKYYTGTVRSETGVPTVTEFIYYYVDKISYSD